MRDARRAACVSMFFPQTHTKKETHSLLAECVYFMVPLQHNRCNTFSIRLYVPSGARTCQAAALLPT